MNYMIPAGKCFLKKQNYQNENDCDIKNIFIEEANTKTEESGFPKNEIIPFQARNSWYLKRDVNSFQKNDHSIKIHKCEQSSFETKYSHYLPQHMIVHQNKEEANSNHYRLQQTKCRKGSHTCTFTQNSKRLDILYKYQECPLHSEKTSESPTRSPIQKNSDEIDIYSCYNCHFHTNHKTSLRTHMLIHKNTNEVPMFKCYTCSYQTKYKHHILLHLVSHKTDNEVIMHKCPQCSFKSKYVTSLRKHMLCHKSENEVRKYQCYLCSYKAKMKCTLKVHLFSFHGLGKRRKN